MPLYQDYEIQVSQSQLSNMLSRLGDDVCLLGGWAVYLTVNRNFSSSQGRNFMGSRNIDLGFHVNCEWTDAQLKSSALARTIATISEAGFKPVSFRYVKYFHAETMEELSEEQARRLIQPFIFEMYIDMIVDNSHPRFKQVFGFAPIDEPLLSEAFRKNEFVTVKDFELASCCQSHRCYFRLN